MMRDIESSACNSRTMNDRPTSVHVRITTAGQWGDSCAAVCSARTHQNQRSTSPFF